MHRMNHAFWPSRGPSGIGEIAAERLAQMGARIVLIARDKSRGEATLRGFTRERPALATRCDDRGS